MTFGNTKKIYISCCSNRDPKWGMVLVTEDAMRHAAKHGLSSVLRPRLGESLICRARQNDLVEFMRTNSDLLFSIDDDVVPPVDVLVKLAEADKDIVAGIYRLKLDTPISAVRLPFGGHSWEEVLQGLLAPAVYVSTGCMMIKRRVIEGMIAKYPELGYARNVTGDRGWALYMPFIHDEEYLSEDWAFCQRAIDAGFEVWVHGGVKCGTGAKNYFFSGTRTAKRIEHSA